jgi:LPS sulfotransferase NodH
MGVTPFDIVYEDLVDPSTYGPTIRSVLSHLGVDTDEIAIPEPRTHRQADGINRDWVKRYRADAVSRA